MGVGWSITNYVFTAVAPMTDIHAYQNKYMKKRWRGWSSFQDDLNSKPMDAHKLVDWILGGDDKTFKKPFRGNETDNPPNGKFEYDLIKGVITEIK